MVLNERKISLIEGHDALVKEGYAKKSDNPSSTTSFTFFVFGGRPLGFLAFDCTAVACELDFCFFCVFEYVAVVSLYSQGTSWVVCPRHLPWHLSLVAVRHRFTWFSLAVCPLRSALTACSTHLRKLLCHNWSQNIHQMQRSFTTNISIFQTTKGVQLAVTKQFDSSIKILLAKS